MFSDPVMQIPLFAAVLFVVLAHPSTFAFMDARLGPILHMDIAGVNDRPTRYGLLLHAAVAALLMYGFLRTYDISSSASFGSAGMY